ncbi:MAG: PDZ domain-containing protein [Candidatus Aminicenantes bacterium]|nr:PDZ domain-containing protein [Candidatus Aminicenantes bacterium]
MKKALFLLLLLLWTVLSAAAAEKIDAIENEIKVVLNQVSPSLVKVVSENAKKYVATGIALENDLIITTSLVTSHPFEKIYVEDINGARIAAAIAGQDDRAGLTLLRLSQKGPRQLPPARQAAVGDWVALIGLFYDRFPAIYQGIISSRSETELIVNAPVAPGSAGGAVVNKKGELLGIIRGSVGFSFTPEYTFKDHSAMIVVSGSKNESGSLCYALPIERVKRIAEKLKTSGKIVYGWLGVSFHGDSNLIQAVEKDSPAQRAGIRKGDQIEEISGNAISSFRDISAALYDKLAGEKIAVQLKRSGKSLRLDMELGERKGEIPFPPGTSAEPEWPELPPMPELSELSESPGWEIALPKIQNYLIKFGGPRQLGVEIIELTPELSRKFGVKDEFGLIVSRLGESSAAQRAGLKAGDIIIRANGRDCRTGFDMMDIMKSLKDKEAVRLELYRDGQLKRFAIIPDKKESRDWDMKKFSKKIQNLKDSIRSEVGTINNEKLSQMRQVREKAAIELRKQREQAMLQFQLESEKLADEVLILEAEKSKINVEMRKKYAEELRELKEKIKEIQKNIASDLAAGKDVKRPGSSSQE